ncbi:hypothetical protein ACQJBY_045399 [Aegilops geniculata]
MTCRLLSTATATTSRARPLSPRPVLLDEYRDWSSLPEELLEHIGKMLNSRRDAFKFRSMCPGWRAALPFTKFFAPMLMMLPFCPNSPDIAVTFFTAADSGETTFTRNLPSLRGKTLHGSSHGWLALVDEAGYVTLLNPLTGATVELPPADERVLAASYSHYTFPDGNWVILPAVRGQHEWVRLEEMKKSEIFREIVLSSSSPGSGDCVAMAALAESSIVAFCRVGVDATWMLLDTNVPKSCVTSVVHFGGSRFLAIFNGHSGRFVSPEVAVVGAISICDVAGAAPTATWIRSLHAAPKKKSDWASKYMQVNGELYLVASKVPGCTNLCRVYKSNIFANRPKWIRVKNAPGVTLFVSTNFTKGDSEGPASVSGFKENSIYCMDYNVYRNQLELKIIDIANGTCEFQPFHGKIKDSAGTLCWIQPNHWE